MTRLLIGVFVTFSVVFIGCDGVEPSSSSVKSVQDADVKPATGDRVDPLATPQKSADMESPALDEPDDSDWQAIETIADEFKFTLRLPPGWKWEEDNWEAGQSTSFECTIFLEIDGHKAFGSGKMESAEAEANKLLASLPDEEERNKSVESKIKILDQRIIKLGDQDAVWLVKTVTPPGQSQPTLMDATCYLRTSGYEFTITGHRDDLRLDRKAKDFDDSQAEFLKISQTFRVNLVAPSDDQEIE